MATGVATQATQPPLIAVYHNSPTSEYGNCGDGLKASFHNAKTFHLVTCRRCKVSYRETHYHCCVCRRVFGSASAYERHQDWASCRPGHPASDAALARNGFIRTPEGVWKRAGAFTRPAYPTKAPTGGEASARRAPSTTREGGAL